MKMKCFAGGIFVVSSEVTCQATILGHIITRLDWLHKQEGISLAFENEYTILLSNIQIRMQNLLIKGQNFREGSDLTTSLTWVNNLF